MVDRQVHLPHYTSRRDAELRREEGTNPSAVTFAKHKLHPDLGRTSLGVRRALRLAANMRSTLLARQSRTAPAQRHRTGWNAYKRYPRVRRASSTTHGSHPPSSVLCHSVVSSLPPSLPPNSPEGRKNPASISPNQPSLDDSGDVGGPYGFVVVVLQDPLAFVALFFGAEPADLVFGCASCSFHYFTVPRLHPCAFLCFECRSQGARTNQAGGESSSDSAAGLCPGHMADACAE